jgi:hypothetical protein
VSLAGSPSAAFVHAAIGQHVYVYRVTKTANVGAAGEAGWLLGPDTPFPPAIPPICRYTAAGAGAPAIDWLSPDAKPAGVRTGEDSLQNGVGVWRGYPYFSAGPPGNNGDDSNVGFGGAYVMLQDADLHLQSDGFQGAIPYDVTIQLVVIDLAPAQFSFFVGGLPGEPGGGLL